MSDNLYPVSTNGEETITKSPELLANEIHLASAFVTPFAAAVAAELEEFGLSKQKIDEIMLRSANRFGDMNGGALRSRGQDGTDSDNKSADYLGWLKSAGGQAYDFLASVVGKHGLVLIDKLAPVVTDALQHALSNFMEGATGSNGRTKGKRKPKSQR